MIAATAGAPGLDRREHGPRHWKCVALTGVQLARRDPEIDLLAVYVFAQLHDSQRHQELAEPEHGPRAAEVLRAAIAKPGIPGFEPESERASKLIEAIRDHTTAAPSDDPTISACWDADRFNLWRVGTVPAIEYISTRVARDHFDELSEYARMLIEAPEPTWREVARALG
jgi:uncharacterized protein